MRSPFMPSLQGPRRPGRRKEEAMAMGILFLLTTFLLIISRSRNIASLRARSESCHFPAIFNFGDSNSDTGNVAAAFALVPFPPNGETFFRRPSGRYSDGRIILDFLAGELGLPYLSAYLNSVASDFKHGANFAAGGATIQHADAKLYAKGFSPFSLYVQISQFEHFKASINELHIQDNMHFFVEESHSDHKNTFPNPKDFSNALYTLDCGQNDIHYMLISTSVEQAQALIPGIVDQFSSHVQTLYKLGGRAFWIHNTVPIGCLPFFIVNYPPEAGNIDQNGCVKSYNEVAQEFNKQLRNIVSSLREKLQDATLVYVDIYSAKYSLISNAKEHGFHPVPEYCCGKTGAVECWQNDIVNGTVCTDPAKYISWDGIHFTEAANNIVANLIKDGSYSEPRLPIAKTCG